MSASSVFESASQRCLSMLNIPPTQRSPENGAGAPFKFLADNQSFLLSIALLSLAVHYFALPWIQRRFRLIYMLSKFPGMPLATSHWLLADFQSFLAQPKLSNGMPDTLSHIHEKALSVVDKGMFRVWFFNPLVVPFARGVIVVFDPDIAFDILGPRAFGKFGKGKTFLKVTPLVGKSLITQPDGIEWKRQRKLISPSFGHSVLENVTQLTGTLLSKLFAKWDTFGHTEKTDGITCIDVVDSMSRFALDLLGEAAFSYSFGGIDAMTNVDGSGHKGESEGGEDNSSLFKTYEFIALVILKRLREIPYTHLLRTEENRRFRKATEKLDATIRDIISSRLKNESEFNGSTQKACHKGKDLLSQLLLKDDKGDYKQKDDSGYRLSEEDILGNMRLFLFAGHDTTSSTLSFALWYIASNPDCQSRLQKEVDSLFSSHESPSYSQLRQLQFLDAVIKETLRLHSPGVVARTRTAVQDVTYTKGGVEYVIPAGAEVIIYNFLIQRNPKYWDRPEVWDPDRFLGNGAGVSEGQVNNELNGKTRPFIPFSLGPRYCIGKEFAMAEMRAALAHIVRRYSLVLDDPEGKVEPFFRITINPVEVKLRLRRRDNAMKD